jgi:hypothetical protein
MDDQNASLNSARQLEEINFTQWIMEASKEANDKVKASERSLAARGLLQSGGRVKTEVDIRFGALEAAIDKIIAFRRELAGKAPALLEPSDMSALKDKLDRYVDGCAKGIQERCTSPANRGAVGDAMTRLTGQRAYAVKAQVNQRLVALPLEVKLGVHQAGGQVVNTFNISNSTIANLNLGNVVGDMNGSIQQLNNDGREDLAEEFRKMTEALVFSGELEDGARRELLEHLSVVSDEAAKPSEQRKMGRLKSSLTAIKAGIAIAAQLFGIYQGLEHALTAAGIIPRG